MSDKTKRALKRKLGLMCDKEWGEHRSKPKWRFGFGTEGVSLRAVGRDGTTPFGGISLIRLDKVNDDLYLTMKVKNFVYGGKEYLASVSQ